MMSKFDRVKEYFNAKLWSDGMVWDAVGRWITENEYLDITGSEYKKA